MHAAVCGENPRLTTSVMNHKFDEETPAVIPAPDRVEGRLQRESSALKNAVNLWIPARARIRSLGRNDGEY